MHGILSFGRVAVRTLLKRRALTAGRLVTVTLVVAAVTAIFTVASATLLKPLPFPSPDRLTRVYLQPPRTTDFAAANPLSPLTFTRYRERLRSFERFEGLWLSERALAGSGDPESLVGARVSPGLFELLGGSPALGRTFSEEEAAADAKVVVLSHGLWTRRFGGDPAVLGSTLLLDRQPHTIIGVVDRGFDSGFVQPELWTPLHLRPIQLQASTFIRTIGLLREGVSIADAQREMTAMLPEIAAESPPQLNGWRPGIRDLRQAQFGSRRPALLMLLSAALALALIATANLSNLTLADVMHRRSEFVLRAALGGGRRTIAAPEITQAMMIAIAGGGMGLLAARWTVPALLSLDPSSQFTARQLELDWRTGLCALGVSLAVMLCSIVVPMLRLAGPRLASELAAGPRRTGTAAATRVRGILVATQTALTLLLLSVGALVAATFYGSAGTAPGFDPRNVVTAQLRLPEQAYSDAGARNTFVTRMLEHVRAIPGVIGAATTMNPFTSGLSFVTAVHIEDRPTTDGQPHMVQFRRVSPRYFETLGISLVSGRDFDHNDRQAGSPVAIVSRGFARRFWGDGDPIGRRIKRGATATQWTTVVGVSDDVLDVSLGREAQDTVYVPVLQDSAAIAPVSLVIRTTGSPAGFIGAIRQAVWAVDPRQPLANVVEMDSYLASTLGPQRFRAMLLAVCAMLGLLLATVGVYSVTARTVSERQREIGIRLALGETHRSVLWTVSRDGLRAVAVGAVIGTAISLVARAALIAFLPELQSGIGPYSAAAGALLLVVGASAALLAARAAASVAPLVALRAD